MPPVEFLSQDQTPTRRIRFKTGVAYKGLDYFENDEATVDERWAYIFIQQGRAVEVMAEAPETEATDSGDAKKGKGKAKSDQGEK